MVQPGTIRYQNGDKDGKRSKMKNSVKTRDGNFFVEQHKTTTMLKEGDEEEEKGEVEVEGGKRKKKGLVQWK